jgi:RNA polymerase sigma-70 factor (ECF subfamily)
MTRETAARVAGIQRRDPEILEEVARECLPGLLRAARAAGLSAVDAEDAVQTTFLTFLRRAEDFDGRSRCSTWLYGILVRKMSELRRSTAREEAADQIDEVISARFEPDGRWARPPASPAAELGQEEVRRLLGECLEGVPDRQRLAYTLLEVDGLSREELCNVLEVSPNNLGVILYRARNRLRECLEARGFRGSADADMS